MLLPGWNSPTEVKEIHDVLEGGALLFFAALVVFEAIAHFTASREKLYTRIGLAAFAVAVLLEIGAYPYSGRNDELSAAAILKEEKEIAVLNEDNAKLQLQIAQANKDAADANHRAEEDHLARVKIEDRFADRLLTDADDMALVKLLKPFSGQEFALTTYPDMREPLAFSQRIYDALNRAGWRFVKHERATMLIGGITGVQVWIHPSAEESTKKAANLLVNQLTKDRIGAQLRLQNPTNNPKNEKIEINIGTKPD
jgi:hypothetical protein